MAMLPYFSDEEVNFIMNSSYGKALLDGQESPEFMRNFAYTHGHVKCSYELSSILNKVFAQLLKEKDKVHTNLINRAVQLYLLFRPELGEGVLQELTKLVVKALERDFEFIGCKYLNPAFL